MIYPGFRVVGVNINRHSKGFTRLNSDFVETRFMQVIFLFVITKKADQLIGFFIYSIQSNDD
jgi:hypothetical protein